MGDVAFYVPPYQVGPRLAEVIDRMSSLQVVQTLTAGVDNLRDRIPAGVTLCNGRGIHDASTAELALTLVLASLRGIPGFVRAQDRREWVPGWRPALADKRVLIVGYGAVGKALEARLAPFEVEVVAVARSARDGVRGRSPSCRLVAHADVVVLIVPLTSETRGLVDARFLARMKDGALLVNVARGPVVVTDDLVAALGTGRIAAAIDVVDPEPLPADHPLWQRSQPADLAPRGWREQRDVAPCLPPGARPAPPVRGRGAAGQRDGRGVLTARRSLRLGSPHGRPDPR